MQESHFVPWPVVPSYAYSLSDINKTLINLKTLPT